MNEIRANDILGGIKQLLIKGAIRGLAMVGRDQIATEWMLDEDAGHVMKKLRTGKNFAYAVVDKTAPTETRLTVDLKFLPAGVADFAKKTQFATFDAALELYQRWLKERA